MLHPPLSLELILTGSRKKQEAAVLEFLTNTLEAPLLRLDAYLKCEPDYSSHFAAIVHERGNRDYWLLVDHESPKDMAPKSPEWYNCLDSLWKNSACMRVFRRNTDFSDHWDHFTPKKDYADLVEIIKGRNIRIRIVPGNIAEYAQELFTSPNYPVLSSITQYSADGKIITKLFMQQHSLPYRIATKIIKETCGLAKAFWDIYSDTSPRMYRE